MHCNHCRAENPAHFSHCAECGLPLFLAVLKEVGQHSGTGGAMRAHHIFASGATIGRHPENTVVLHDLSLSRFHARIDYKNSRFFIQDLNRSNGIFVNDAKVHRREIKDFDRLALGETMLLFRTGSPATDTQTHHRKLRPAVFHNLVHNELYRDEFEVSRSSILAAENTGEMVIREECLSDPHYKHNQSIQALQFNTIICLPLKSSHPLAIATIHDGETERHSPQGQAVKAIRIHQRRTQPCALVLPGQRNLA